MAENPLSSYYRRPGIQIHLPSGSRYYGHPIDTSSNGEIPVYPMTASDEIIINNPDGLLNGSGIEAVIKSCVPAIQFPKDLCVADIDILMLAIKLVSFGPKFELAGACPKCHEESKFEFNIRNLLEEATEIPEPEGVRLNDELVAHIRPYSFKTATLLNMKEFEEAKILQVLMNNEETTEEVRINALSESFQRVTNLGLSILYQSVISISTPEGEVTEAEFIKDFLANAPSDVIKKIRTRQEELGKYGMPKRKKVVCKNKECKSHWELPIVYDPSSFFA